VHHRSAVPPLPARLRPAPEDGSARASGPARPWTRLSLRVAVASALTMLVVGGPVVSGHSSTSAVVDSSASSAAPVVESPVVMGQDGLSAPPAPPAPPAPETTPAPAPVAEETAAPVSSRAPAATEQPDASAPPQAAAEPADPSAEGQVLALVNTERAAAGCGALVGDDGLAAVARAHSADMRDRGYFDHVTPEGLDPFDRAERAGQTARAENIAMGQQDPAEVMTAWMNSPGHRANILDCSLTRLGVGIAQGSGGPWWTQLFG
jgi:uncharacterized protein YkwD